jgi:hypothetical protein
MDLRATIRFMKPAKTRTRTVRLSPFQVRALQANLKIAELPGPRQRAAQHAACGIVMLAFGLKAPKDEPGAAFFGLK